MIAEPARPTLRCLREDLKIPLPPVNWPLDEIDHPLVRKAAEHFADPDSPHERIRAIDDEVLFKVKVQRWRGAVWIEANLPWLVAGGQREDGSTDDFYAALETSATTARARYNAEHTPALTTTTYTEYLLPAREDDLRYRAEEAARTERRLRPLVHDLSAARFLTAMSTPSCSAVRPWASMSWLIRATKHTSRSGSSDQSRNAWRRLS